MGLISQNVTTTDSASLILPDRRPRKASNRRTISMKSRMYLSLDVYAAGLSVARVRAAARRPYTDHVSACDRFLLNPMTGRRLVRPQSCWCCLAAGCLSTSTTIIVLFLSPLCGTLRPTLATINAFLVRRTNSIKYSIEQQHQQTRYSGRGIRTVV
jgi:hypothetical protein